MQPNANVTPCKRISPGRAQSRNSSWSTAMSPRRPSPRLVCRYSRKSTGMRPRKMSASLQPLTLEWPGRHTTRLEPLSCDTDAHSGVGPRPVSPRGGYREGEGESVTRENVCFRFRAGKFIVSDRFFNSLLLCDYPVVKSGFSVFYVLRWPLL